MTVTARLGVGLTERAYVPTLVTIGTVISVISSLGAPLIPSIAVEMHASLGAAQWSLTATLLVGAVTTPLVGRLGDGPHRRGVLIACLSIVTLGGAIAALAATLPVLIVGRALQGVGIALMPLTMASARDHLAAARAREVIALLSVIGAAGVGLGYPLTGFIAEHFDASAAFWFGSICSGIALALAALFVPAPRSPAHHTALDIRGAALIGAGLLSLLLVLETGTAWGWGARPTIGLLAAACVLLGLWVRNELRVPEPLVELRLLRSRGVLTANVTGFVLGIAMYLTISLTTQVVQLPGGLHHSVFIAGMTLVPFAIVSTASSRLLPAVSRNAGPKASIPIGALVMTSGMLFFAATGTALWEAFVLMGLVGLGLGFTFAAMPNLIIGSVPQRETSSAMSFYQVTRYVGYSVGSGLAATLLRAFSPDGITGTHGAFSATFAIGASLSLVAAIVSWVLPGRLSQGTSSVPTVALAADEGELAAAR